MFNELDELVLPMNLMQWLDFPRWAHPMWSLVSSTLSSLTRRHVLWCALFLVSCYALFEVWAALPRAEGKPEVGEDDTDSTQEPDSDDPDSDGPPQQRSLTQELNTVSSVLRTLETHNPTVDALQSLNPLLNCVNDVGAELPEYMKTTWGQVTFLTEADLPVIRNGLNDKLHKDAAHIICSRIYHKVVEANEVPLTEAVEANAALEVDDDLLCMPCGEGWQVDEVDEVDEVAEVEPEPEVAGSTAAVSPAVDVAEANDTPQLPRELELEFRRLSFPLRLRPRRCSESPRRQPRSGARERSTSVMWLKGRGGEE